MVSSYGFDVSDAIKIGGSDAASADFIANVLPNLYPAANQKVASSQVSSSFTAAALDSKGLTLKQDYLVRIYFVGETTSNLSTLGFTTNDSSASSSVIFDNASTLANLKGEGLGSTNRTSKAPLQPGDFVDLGFFTAGTNLDFYLISQTPSGKTAGVYSTQQSANADGLSHAMALTSEGSSYLMIGFEDEKNGGDKDFNDLVFAIQFIAQGGGGASGGVAAPEPSLALGSVFAFGALALQRRRRA
jgi:Domain of unknown function (DUF4114)